MFLVYVLVTLGTILVIVVCVLIYNLRRNKSNNNPRKVYLEYDVAVPSKQDLPLAEGQQEKAFVPPPKKGLSDRQLKSVATSREYRDDSEVIPKSENVSKQEPFILHPLEGQEKVFVPPLRQDVVERQLKSAATSKEHSQVIPRSISSSDDIDVQSVRGQNGADTPPS